LPDIRVLDTEFTGSETDQVGKREGKVHMEENCRASDGEWKMEIVFFSCRFHIWSHSWTEKIKFVNAECINRTRISSLYLYIEDALASTFGIIQGVHTATTIRAREHGNCELEKMNETS
jgi:hypothetical protein